MSILFILVISVIILLVAGICVGMYFAGGGSAHTPQTPAPPIPGGGGVYMMMVEGMNCDHCKANVEAALNAFEGIKASADWKTGVVRITYTGLPDLGLLDRLKAAVEQAGFTVVTIQ